jgi:hypothetical protein
VTAFAPAFAAFATVQWAKPACSVENHRKCNKEMQKKRNKKAT